MFISLPPMIVIFLMSGLFSVQGIINIYSIARSKPGYQQLPGSAVPYAATFLQLTKGKKWLLVMLILLGICLQIGGVGSASSFMIADRDILPIGCFSIPCFLLLSLAWTNSIQKLTFSPSKAFIERAQKLAVSSGHSIKPVSARWKASK